MGGVEIRLIININKMLKKIKEKKEKIHTFFIN